MSTDSNNVQAEAPHALLDFTSCPDWGKGGQFIYDPVTRTRTRVELDESVTDVTAQAPATQALQEAAPAEASATVRKERSRA